MIQEITRWILESIQNHGPLSVFVGVIIESVIVPIPSPLIIMGAGAILIAPDLKFMEASVNILKLIVLPGAVASTLGAYIGYGIGFWGGKPMIEKLQKFLGFGWKDVEFMERRWSGRQIGWSIFSLRALPIIPMSLISAAAGVIRLPVGSFTWWTFLGSVPRCLFLAYLGWALRDTYYSLAHRLNFMESLISAGLVAAAVFLVLWLRLRISRES